MPVIADIGVTEGDGVFEGGFLPLCRRESGYLSIERGKVFWEQVVEKGITYEFVDVRGSDIQVVVEFVDSQHATLEFGDITKLQAPTGVGFINFKRKFIVDGLNDQILSDRFHLFSQVARPRCTSLLLRTHQR